MAPHGGYCLVLRQMSTVPFLLLPQPPSSRQASPVPPSNTIYRNTVQIEQLRVGMFSEYEMIQLFNILFYGIN